MIEFTVTMIPIGKQRPFVHKKGAFTPKKTMVAEQEIRDGWATSASVRLDGPIRLYVGAYWPRPKSHYKKNGSLNTTGEANPYPTRRPDADNILKLVADALNGFAWNDDAQIVYATVFKGWADTSPTGTACIHVKAIELGGPGPNVE